MVGKDEDIEEERMEIKGSKEDMNKPSDISTISVNGHEKMGAFKSKSLWQPTTTEGRGEKNIFFSLNKKPFS